MSVQDIPIHKYGRSKAYITHRRIKMDSRFHEVAHRHNFYQLLFTESGGGHHEIDFINYKTKPGSFHFVGKGQVHKVDFTQDTQGDVFTFPEELFSASETEIQLLNSLAFFSNGCNPILKCTKTEMADLQPFLNQLIYALSNESHDTNKFLFFALLGKLRDVYNKREHHIIESSDSLEFDAYRNALRLMDLETNRIDEIALKLKIQLPRLNQICKKNTGKTALQLLHDRKALAAKRMLAYTNKQIKEVSLECGFNDMAYFNRFFKKHTNMSPSQFKKQHKNTTN